MLIHLVKKDFLIVKKYVLIMLAVCILIPLFIAWKAPEQAGVSGFVLSAVFGVFMLLQHVSMKECLYPKASAMLCAAPYPRKLLVLSKYIFCLLIYLACCLIFGIETFIVSGFGELQPEMFLFVFLVLALFLSVYLPVQFQLGYEKTKFFFMIIIMASPFILPLLQKVTNGYNLDFLGGLPITVLYGVMILVSIIMLLLSFHISVRFYCKKDLT